MSTLRKPRWRWHREPYFWCGWAAGGNVAVAVYAVTLISTGTDPHWIEYVGYAAATFPPVVAAYIAARSLRRQSRELARRMEELNRDAR